eukprot:g1330.t1
MSRRRGKRSLPQSKTYLTHGRIVETKFIGNANEDDTVVLARTDKGLVYRSTNGGVDFQMLDLGVVNEMIKEIDVSGDHVYLISNDLLFWKSEDCGRTFSEVKVPKAFESAKINKKYPQHILGLSMSPGCGTYTGDLSDGTCHRELWGSKDSGGSWTKLARYVVTYDFVHNLPSDHHTARHSADAVFLTSFIDTRHDAHQEDGFWDEDINLHLINSWGSSLGYPVVKGCNRFASSGKFLICAKVTPSNKKGKSIDIDLMISGDDGKYWHKAQLPFTLHEGDFDIISSTDDHIYLLIDRNGYGTHGALYVSDDSGTHFILLKDGVIRSKDGLSDAAHIQYMKGVIMGNFVVNVESVEEKMAKNARQRLSGKNKIQDEDIFAQFADIQSWISYDSGTIWNKVRTPDCKRKVESCYLHFHGSDYNTNRFYSRIDAPGIVMSTGNVGRSADPGNTATVHTYLSIDGGRLWNEVAQKSNVYDYIDYGGIIVMVNNMDATDTLQYSTDYGDTWTNYKFTEKPFYVKAVVSHKKEPLHLALIYGEDRSGAGIFASVDFESLCERQCGGAESIGEKSSDFEYWNPMGEDSQYCQMGAIVKFVRRKPEKTCFNVNGVGLDPDLPWATRCECTRVDFACDVGFYNPGDGTLNCVRDESMEVRRIPPPHCPYGDTYAGLTGYRKVPGNNCRGGVESTFIGSRQYCPLIPSVSNGGLLVLIVIIGLAIYTYINGNDSGNQKQGNNANRPSIHRQNVSNTFSAENIQGALGSLLRNGRDLFKSASNAIKSDRHTYEKLNTSDQDFGIDYNEKETPQVISSEEHLTSDTLTRRKTKNPFSPDVKSEFLRNDDDDFNFEEEMDKDLMLLSGNDFNPRN